MEPLERDFDFPRGDTCPISFTLTDLLNNELDLTEVEVYFTFKQNFNKSDFIFQKRFSLGEIEIEGKDGNLLIEHEDTANLPYGNYVYDIQFVSGKYVKTLAIGTIELTKESTHIINENSKIQERRV